MRGFTFLLLSFLVALQLQAQQDQGYSPEAPGLLNPDSLGIGNPNDSLDQWVDNYEGKLNGLKDDLNTTIALPDTLLRNNPIDSINQKKEAAQQKASAVTDSLKQNLQMKFLDSLMNLVPKEAVVLPEVDIPELDIKPLEELKGISEINKIDPLNKIETIKNPVDIETVTELEQVGVIRGKLKESTKSATTSL